MAVITTDILLEGFRRDQVFEWLGDFSQHAQFLAGAFDQVESISESELLLSFSAGFKTRQMKYILQSHDSSHGGRRIKIKTEGKRTAGHLHYSLRTMKPTSNTLITLHFDYTPGTLLGTLLNEFKLQEDLQELLAKVLSSLQAQLKNSANKT